MGLGWSHMCPSAAQPSSCPAGDCETTQIWLLVSHKCKQAIASSKLSQQGAGINFNRLLYMMHERLLGFLLLYKLCPRVENFSGCGWGFDFEILSTCYSSIEVYGAVGKAFISFCFRFDYKSCFANAHPKSKTLTCLKNEFLKESINISFFHFCVWTF